MGASSSTESGGSHSQQEDDIRYLGDRMPFGDVELWQVYRAYQKLLLHEKRVSFLADMGVLSVPPPRAPSATKTTNQQQPSQPSKSPEVIQLEFDQALEERLYLLQAVEQKILPPDFGNTLYRTCFLQASLPESSEYDVNLEGNGTVVETHVVDEFDRKARLERFFDGLSNSTRRGSKAAVKCMIQCCKHYPSPKEGTDATTNNYNVNETAYAGGGPLSGESSREEKTLIEPMELINMGYRVSLAAAFLKATTEKSINRDIEDEKDEEEDDDEEDVSRFLPPVDETVILPGLQALANSLSDFATKRRQRMVRSITPTTDRVDLVDEEDVLEWAEQVAPMFGSILPTFLHLIVFPGQPSAPSRTSFDYPQISQESTIFPSASSPLLFAFGCMSSALGGAFYRLYTSASDGLSFNRLQNALLGYGGPTLVIIQSGPAIFGAFTASPWKESKDFYGNHDCFLYRLFPDTIAVYRPTGSNDHFMYCNSFARSRGYDQQAHGIGFGGTTDGPRLFLAESFDNCQAGSDDLTFEKGSLLSLRSTGGDTTFEIDNLEVWGVGGTEVVQESLQARTRSRDIRQAAIQKARKVDKAAFLDDFKNGLIGSKAFAHRDQIQGREGSAVEDDSNNVYKYE